MSEKDILSYYNLEQNPFSKEIKTSSLMSLPTIKQAEDEINLLLETKGIGLLTGPSGCGKSSLIRKTAENLNPGLYKPFYICHTSLATAEFYQTFSAALGLSAQGRRSTVFRRIQRYIMELNDQQKIHPVIFIDEAQALSSDTLKDFRMITNFDYDSRNACTLILSGQPELKTKLSLNAFESLANNITYSISMNPLPVEETFNFIENRISETRGSQALFTKNAMKLIHDISKGILRTTSNVAWRAIIKGYNHKSSQIEREHVQMVIER